MRSGPKVTVALPTYNRARYLQESLRSILKQTLLDFEVIVSDNCSTDNTEETVCAFSDSRIRYRRNDSNLGVFPNMNRCLELAQGEYVVIVHDDDLFAPQFLERECEMLDKHPRAGMVHCAAYEIDANGIPRGMFRAYPDTTVLDGERAFVRFLEGHNIYCPTVMVRRTLYRSVDPWDPRYLCADYLMWLRLALEADVAYIAEPLAAVRIHPERMSSETEPLRWLNEFLEIFEQGLKWGEKACPELLGPRKVLIERVARAQGRRFFVAALAAVAEGQRRTALEYVEVLKRLQMLGLPRRYALGARISCNRAGQSMLSSVRQFRRLWARRDLPVQVDW